MRVLVGCEESGVVRDEFAALGHDAWSNDLIPSRRGGKHLQKCVKLAIVEDGPWDIIILHPECTKIAVSGNSTYGTGMPKNAERLVAIEWTVDLFNLACLHARIGVAMENPVGVLPKGRLPGPCYIHPWQFGHMEQKKTGLWLYHLPPLQATDNVYESMMNLPKNIRERLHYMSPGPTRKRDRSETYIGIAKAMAKQWGTNPEAPSLNAPHHPKCENISSPTSTHQYAPLSLPLSGGRDPESTCESQSHV